MNSILLCCHSSSMMTARKMMELGQLTGIVIPSRDPVFHKEMSFFAKISNVDLLAVEMNELKGSLADWLQKKKADVIVVQTFPYLLPDEVINMPKYGTWNIHAGKLPEFRGPAPLFWQMKQGLEEVTMTLHKMNESYDSGAIFQEKNLKVSAWDTYDVVFDRLSQIAPDMVEDLFKALPNGELELQEQKEANAGFQKKPTADDLLIHWESMNATEVASLVRACNVSAGGAMTYFRSMEYKMYEVTALAMTDPPEAVPGTVASIDNDPNLYIICKDSSILRIGVIGMSRLVCSGTNFKMMMQLNAGESFTTGI